ncbi:MAG: hypothetical protein SNI45_07540 [Rikenellaceae bacterium]
MKKLIMLSLAAIFSLSATMVMAQPPQGGNQPSAKEQVETLQKELDLSKEQSADILKMYENRTMPERGSREAMEKMMEEEKESMKKILTEKQYTAWEKLMEKQRPQGPPQH